jgi:hypothetical protein
MLPERTGTTAQELRHVASTVTLCAAPELRRQRLRERPRLAVADDHDPHQAPSATAG